MHRSGSRCYHDWGKMGLNEDIQGLIDAVNVLLGNEDRLTALEAAAIDHEERIAALEANPSPPPIQPPPVAPPPGEFDTSYDLPTGGTTHALADGDDLQLVLDLAEPGDVIELTAGATFTGNFVLPKKTGTGWIYIISSDIGSLPEHVRVGMAESRVDAQDHQPE